MNWPGVPTPKLVQCLREGYRLERVRRRPGRGRDRRAGRAPARDGVRDLVRAAAAGGIYCAVVAGFLISALGGSRVQIGGPTGAFVVVVAGIVAHHGVDGLFMCTLMAGVILLLLGVTGLGTAVNFIPRPVIVGFTNGIAVLIASTQINDFFGLDAGVPGEFLGRAAEDRGQRWTRCRCRPRCSALPSLAADPAGAVVAADSRHHRGAGRGDGPSAFAAGCRSRPSARASAASPRASRRSISAVPPGPDPAAAARRR